MSRRRPKSNDEHQVDVDRVPTRERVKAIDNSPEWAARTEAWWRGLSPEDREFVIRRNPKFATQMIAKEKNR